jgi:predicted signal transduction protein with EAL and GGDEF domain
MGHWAGDELLTGVGKLLADRLRDTDIVARLGGDEFTIILPHTDVEQGRIVAEQLIATLGNHKFRLADQTFVITASVGIALIPEHGATAEELLSHADVAMYQAKENGRNRVCIYSPYTDWRAQTESRLNWRKRIGDALECERFQLYAQPILDLRTNEISQYELLLRMIDPDGEVVDAAEFIDSAERFGLMQAIDRWVVQRGIRFASEVNGSGRDVKMEINISGKAFADEELLPIIRRELASTQIDPHKIIFEVTETAAIHNIHEAREFVDELKRIGCKFALDDFGVGFSSFYQLKSLDVDYLKIDGSFIQDLPSDAIDQHLVKAMVEVARALNKETIAEFVADEETTQLLREFGVGFAQGYHIGRPCPPMDIEGASELAA